MTKKYTYDVAKKVLGDKLISLERDYREYGRSSVQIKCNCGKVIHKNVVRAMENPSCKECTRRANTLGEKIPIRTIRNISVNRLINGVIETKYTKDDVSVSDCEESTNKCSVIFTVVVWLVCLYFWAFLRFHYYMR